MPSISGVGSAAPSSQPLDVGALLVLLLLLYLEVSYPLLKSGSRNIALIMQDVSGCPV